MKKKNQTEKSNSFSTIKVPFVSNEIECHVLKKCKYQKNEEKTFLFSIKPNQMNVSYCMKKSFLDKKDLYHRKNFMKQNISF